VLVLALAAPAVARRPPADAGDADPAEAGASDPPDDEALAGEVILVEGTAPEVAEPARRRLEPGELDHLPGAGNDPLRALQILPGFARPPFGAGAILVRGVSPRNSAVFVDGVRVPLAFHFVGLTSFYPASLLDRVEVFPSAAVAPFGRTLGAVVDLRTRRARADRWRVGGEVGLLDAAAYAEGPARGGAVLVGVRRSYVDAVLRAADLGDDLILPSYLDAQIRFDRGDPADRGAWTVLLLGSEDRVAGDTGAALGFTRLIVSWDRRVDGVALRVAPWLGRDLAGVYLAPGLDQQEGDVVTTERRALPGGLRAELSGSHRRGFWAAGLDLDTGRYGPTTTRRIALVLADGYLFRDHVLEPRWVTSFGLWTETLVQSHDGRFAVRPGLRLDHFDHGPEWALDPRVTVSQRVDSQLTLRQSVAIQHQPPGPSDLDWGDTNPDLQSSWASHLVAGAELALTATTALSAAVYRIDGHRLPVVPLDAEPEAVERWGDRTAELGLMLDELLEAQIGTFGFRESTGWLRNQGVEVDVRHRRGRLAGYLAYTWSRARRAPRSLLGHAMGEDPYVLDQTHVLNAIGTLALGRWQLGARVRSATGNPVELGAAGLPFGYGRLPPFASLDLRVDRAWPRPWGTVIGYLDLQNATNRRNLEGATTRGLPILPFLGVAFRPD
jgi:hypothetical protein